MAMFSCEGCYAKFKWQGDLIQHLTKSENMMCIAAHQVLRNKMRPINSRRDLLPKRQTIRSGSPMQDQHSIQFEGDFFGDDHFDVDFPFPEDGMMLDHLDKVDVDEKSMDSEGPTEAGTEAHDRRFENVTVSTEPADSEMDVEEDEAVCRSGRAPGGISIESHNHLEAPPIYVTKFGGQAGKPIPTSPHNGQFSYSDYVEQTGGEENIWALFELKIEWEIAQWAKMRGPGSTAFTEFLEIEGVHRQCSSLWLCN